MPIQLLNLIERKQLNSFPEETSSEDLIKYFSLSTSDKLKIPQKTTDFNQLGFMLQLCTLRYTGFFPIHISSIPIHIIEYLSKQLNIAPECIKVYGSRNHTKTDHQQKIIKYLGYRKFDEKISKKLSNWLLERALEHDKPFLLLQIACEKLRNDKIVRPGVTLLERIVTRARQEAQEVIYNRIKYILTNKQKSYFDKIITPDTPGEKTLLSWLRYGETSNTPKSILNAISKLLFLREQNVDEWDLSNINPNRRKFMAQLGRKSTNQILQRTNPKKRYPILITFLKQCLEDVIDELIELFDRCLAEAHGKAKRELREFQLSISKSTNEKIILFRKIGQILLNNDIPDSKIRDMVFNLAPKHNFSSAVDECEKLIRPQQDNSWDYLVKKYNYFRRFIPDFLKYLNFHSNVSNNQIIEAISILRKIDEEEKRKIPSDAPTGFIPKSWMPYILDDRGQIVRRYYEICTLWELRGSLRSGDIWVEGSRKYADLETYLIPQDKWLSIRKDVCKMLGISESGNQKIEERKQDMVKISSELDSKISKDGEIRIENNEILFPRLKAEELSESCLNLQDIITKRLPRIELADLLIEVDNWVNYSRKFKHASGSEPRSNENLKHLYAAIMAQACDFGFDQMAKISDLSYSKLAWSNNWYIREETLKGAIDELVNYHYKQSISNYWGGGIMASADGQRFPVPIKTRNSVYLPKYFGYGRGLTFYSWTSDQFSQFGSKVIPSTVRDATYVLDAILDNETELNIMELATDTAGYTEIVFALFDLLGLTFSPRIRDLSKQKIYRIDKSISYNHINSIFSGTINKNLILNNWDDMLRIAGSLKLGWVTASMFISKLQSYPRQNNYTKALQEYGKLVKSIYIPTYICRDDKQKRVSLQLNKGESLHDLRKFLRFANAGEMRKSQLEDQANQVSCLTLLTNAVIVWNTRYIEKIINLLKAEGYSVKEEDIAHISPCRFEHINRFGRYNFNVDQELNRNELRPLREML